MIAPLLPLAPASSAIAVRVGEPAPTNVGRALLLGAIVGAAGAFAGYAIARRGGVSKEAIAGGVAGVVVGTVWAIATPEKQPIATTGSSSSSPASDEREAFEDAIKDSLEHRDALLEARAQLESEQVT